MFQNKQFFYLIFLLIVKWQFVISNDDFTHDWVVAIAGGDENKANEIAEKFGYKNLGKVIDDIYHFQKQTVEKRVRRSLDEHTQLLLDEPAVIWAEQQKVLLRHKRDFLDEEIKEFNELESIVKYNDPQWFEQWYLHVDPDPERGSKRETKQVRGAMDLQVQSVWKRGITGKGTVVTILDDGLEMDHPDLKWNVDRKACYDFNDEDDDPTPRYDKDKFNKHGTRCAGEVAMHVNNKICGVGVAYDAKIGGIRMLDGPVTDIVEAKSLGYNNDYIHVYSASWGPNDDGTKLEGPGILASKALENGVNKGRDGKGVIYVWASGNGGRKGDDCACDGYASNIYTISVSSVAQSLKPTWYSEKCPSIMAVTYSSGLEDDGMIVSIDLNATCTDRHSGTSASAPLAAGIIALVLQANPDLTWRDVQHLIAVSGNINPLLSSDKWQQNSAGFYVSSRFGFGLFNAEKMVKLAEEWQQVPDKVICEVPISIPQANNFTSAKPIEVTVESDGCFGTGNEINYLEHIQVVLNVSHPRRGDLSIFFTSPRGMKTVLLHVRENDLSKHGIKNWAFMTVHNWGESPRGKWTVTVMDKSPSSSKVGFLKSAKIVFHGTRIAPAYVTQEAPRDLMEPFKK